MAKRKGGCLMTLLGIILIIVIAGFVLLNLTPNTLGFGDLEIPFIDTSLNEMGLGDTKIIDIIKAISTLAQDSDKLREKLVTNPAAGDTSAADAHYGTGTDYSNIFNSPLTPTATEPFTLTDSEIGGIFNAAAGGLASGAGLPSGAVEVEQFTITSGEEGTSAEVVMSANLEELLTGGGIDEDTYNQIQEQLEKFGVSLGDDIFLTVNVPLTEGESGIEPDEGAQILINGNEVLTNILAGILDASGSSFNLDSLAQDAAGLVSDALNNLGGDVTLENGSIIVNP